MAPDAGPLQIANKLQLLIATTEVMLSRDAIAPRGPDLDSWTREVNLRAVAAAQVAGALRPGDSEALRYGIEQWRSQPALIRALLSEIIGLIHQCQATPDMLGQVGRIMRKL